MATRNKSTTTTLAMVEIDDSAFRKSNEAIGLRVVEGSLSLLAHKIFNIMLWHAQRTAPGVNAPEDSSVARKYFWIRLADLAKDAAYESRDMSYIKQSLNDMLDIKLMMETHRRWTSERLVSSVTIYNPNAGQSYKNQPIWIGYAFPPEVHEHVVAPSTYTKLSIVYQSVIRSGHALKLYEICRRYATNPTKRTGIHSIEYWWQVLTGAPIDPGSPPVYKYFKRDVLKGAISEVNTLTDITVELIEHKIGRSVGNLQFSVELSQQTAPSFDSVIDTSLLDKIEDIGFNRAESEDILGKFANNVIKVALMRFEARKNDQNAKPLITPGGYFRWLLKNLRDNPPSDSEINGEEITVIDAPNNMVKNETTLMDRFLAARSVSAFEVYLGLSSADREKTFEVFKDQQEGRVLNLERGLDSKAVRSLFSRWYAGELWGEPTAEALAAFVEKYGVTAGGTAETLTA